jgi:hypothetical protein
MSTYTYIVSNDKTASVLYFLNSIDAPKPKQMPRPKSSDEQPTGTGSMMEAWTEKLVKPRDDAVEGGLYSALFPPPCISE